MQNMQIASLTIHDTKCMRRNRILWKYYPRMSNKINDWLINPKLHRNIPAYKGNKDDVTKALP